MQTTIKSMDADFFYNFKECEILTCVYSHTVVYPEENKIMFIGVCPLKDVLLAPDARKNSAWREHVSHLESVNLTIHATAEKPYEAHNFAANLIRTTNPYCNITGQIDGSNGKVRCTTDGREFESASKAAEFYGFTAGALSRHLSGKTGYATIHKKKFIRI